MKSLKYPSINGLRAVSISFVLLSHLAIQNQIFINLVKYSFLKPIIYFIQDGQLGVNVFFIISGFLITSLLLEEKDNSNSISLKKFYARRTLRIFPAYYFLLFIYFILQKIGYIDISPNAWLTALTYTKYINWQIDWYTGHAWSLSIEEQFYIFWPLIFLMGRKVSILILWILIFTVPLIKIYVFYNPIAWINYLTLFERIDAIAIGCLAAFYKQKILHFTAKRLNILALISFFLLFFMRYLVGPLNKLHLKIIYISLGETYGSISNILILILMMYSIYNYKSIWFKFLNTKLLNFIGSLSYSIYLWQQLFIVNSKHWINQFPQNLLLILCCSLFSFYLIELPFLKLKRNFNVRK